MEIGKLLTIEVKGERGYRSAIISGQLEEKELTYLMVEFLGRQERTYAKLQLSTDLGPEMFSLDDVRMITQAMETFFDSYMHYLKAYEEVRKLADALDPEID